jgi:hypothetical protein
LFTLVDYYSYFFLVKVRAPAPGPGGVVKRLFAGVVAIPAALPLAVVFLALADAPRADATCAGPVPASADLDTGTRERINALKATYEAVGRHAELPWTALAAVDYRESGNDPDRSALAGEPLGSANPDHPEVTTSSKTDSLERAAAYLKDLSASVYGVSLGPASTGQDMQLAFLAYNRGSIYRAAGVGPDRSPYVMNQADAAHADMTWPDIPGEPLAGRTEYGRYGAWTVFSRLGGAGGSCAGLSDVRIVRVAQEQLGLAEDPEGCNCGPQIQKFLGSSAGEAWCADFVSWVYATAGHPFSGGLDGGWRLPGVSGLRAWLVTNGIWHDRGDADVPRPGDVIVFRDDDHVGIVEALDGATVRTIEGNTSNAVGRRTYGDYATNPEILGWGRMRAPAP